MTNRNFRKNLLLALGSLGAPSGAVNTSMPAMEDFLDNISQNKAHEILNGTLDDGIGLANSYGPFSKCK